MAVQGTIVVCAVCGNKMLIPVGYENKTARCRKCNSNVAQPANSPADMQIQLNSDLLDLSPAPKRVAPSQPRTPESRSSLIKNAAMGGIIWGAVGWAAGGVIASAAVAVALILLQGASSQIYNAVFAGGDFGTLIGGVAGCIAGVITRVEPKLPIAMTIGATIGLLGTSSHHIVEASFVALSDKPLWADSFIGLAGGAAVAVGTTLYRQYRDDT